MEFERRLEESIRYIAKDDFARGVLQTTATSAHGLFYTDFGVGIGLYSSFTQTKNRTVDFLAKVADSLTRLENFGLLDRIYHQRIDLGQGQIVDVPKPMRYQATRIGHESLRVYNLLKVETQAALKIEDGDAQEEIKRLLASV